MKKLVALIAIILILGIGGGWYWKHSAAPPAAFRTTQVKRGELLATISATGTVEPEEVIDVGAQVAGLIEYFGKDPAHPERTVDYGSEVNQGTVLAHIDDTMYAAEVENAQATVDAAKAAVARAQADLGQVNAKLVEAQHDWTRAQKIGPSDALSENDYDMYEANFETAKANVGVDNAAVTQAQTTVAQAEAQLKKAQKNLSYCTIISPVKGVIIDRRVNIGQTVVSSLSAPSLFLIAKDLKRMQVWASVNEADVGNVYAGQPVTFTADAFPGKVFQGTVGKVRLNATMTQNVVTYTVEVVTDNSEGKLLPYLTANVQFQVAKKSDVLLVPNAALRWTPQANQVVPDARDEAAEETPANPTTAPSDSAPHHGKHAGGQSHEHGFVYVKDGIFVRPVPVRLGVTDGTTTEVDGKDVSDGMEIVVGDAIEDSSTSATSNPFIPQFGKGAGGRRNGKGS